MEADLIDRLAMDAMLSAPIAPAAGDGVRITCSCGEDATAFVRHFAALISEECAKVCEAVDKRRQVERYGSDDEWSAINECADAIRAKFTP